MRYVTIHQTKAKTLNNELGTCSAVGTSNSDINPEPRIVWAPKFASSAAHDSMSLIYARLPYSPVQRSSPALGYNTGMATELGTGSKVAPLDITRVKSLEAELKAAR